MSRTNLATILYSALFLTLALLVAREFSEARKIGRPTAPNSIELISTRRPTLSVGGQDIWRLGPLTLKCAGLAGLESSPEYPTPWKHGLRPGVRLTLGAHRRRAKLHWEFDNGIADQHLTIRMDDHVVRQEQTDIGNHSGELELPGGDQPLVLALEFSRSIDAPPDPRSIAVTFHSLRISFR